MCVFRRIFLFREFLFCLGVCKHALTSNERVQQGIDSLCHPLRFQDVIESESEVLPIVEGYSQIMKKSCQRGLAGCVTLTELLAELAIIIKGDVLSRHF